MKTNGLPKRVATQFFDPKAGKAGVGQFQSLLQNTGSGESGFKLADDKSKGRDVAQQADPGAVPARGIFGRRA